MLHPALYSTHGDVPHAQRGTNTPVTQRTPLSGAPGADMGVCSPICGVIKVRSKVSEETVLNAAGGIEGRFFRPILRQSVRKT